MRTRFNLSIRAHIMDAKPQGPTRPTLAAAQARFTKSNTRDRDSHVLGNVLLALAARTRSRLGLSFDDRSARDGEWSLWRAASRKLEQTLTRGLQFRQVALGFTALCSSSWLFRHVFGHSE
jgi:hypothetical protein